MCDAAADTYRTRPDTTGHADVRSVLSPQEARRVLRLHGATKGAWSKALTWQALDALRQEASRPLARAAAEHFAEQAEAVTAALARDAAELASAQTTKRIGEGTVASFVRRILSPDSWVERLRARLRRPVLDALGAGFDAGILSASFEGTFNRDAPSVERTMRQILGNQKDVDETTLDALVRALMEGIDRAETRGQLAARVMTVYRSATTSRAEGIAQTVATSAFESGQMEAFREAGIVAKRWLSQRDANVRASHSAADGQERPLDEPFVVEGVAMMHPGDPSAPVALTIRCRCSMSPLLREARKADTPRPVSWRDERDAAIRAAYPVLKAKHGNVGAFEQIADDETAAGRSITARQVRRIVYAGRSASDR